MHRRHTRVALTACDASSSPARATETSSTDPSPTVTATPSHKTRPGRHPSGTRFGRTSQVGVFAANCLLIGMTHSDTCLTMGRLTRAASALDGVDGQLHHDGGGTPCHRVKPRLPPLHVKPAAGQAPGSTSQGEQIKLPTERESHSARPGLCETGGRRAPGVPRAPLSTTFPPTQPPWTRSIPRPRTETPLCCAVEALDAVHHDDVS